MGCLGCSNAGWDHLLGYCKTGHGFVVLGPVLGKGWGMSLPDIQRVRKWAAVSWLLFLLQGRSKLRCSHAWSSAWSSVPCGVVPWPGDACPWLVDPLPAHLSVSGRRHRQEPNSGPNNFLQGISYSTLSTESLL